MKRRSSNGVRGKGLMSDKMAGEWREQQAEAQWLDAEIERNLKRLGFGAGMEERQ